MLKFNSALGIHFPWVSTEKYLMKALTNLADERCRLLTILLRDLSIIQKEYGENTMERRSELSWQI